MQLLSLGEGGGGGGGGDSHIKVMGWSSYLSGVKIRGLVSMPLRANRTH